MTAGFDEYENRQGYRPCFTTIMYHRRSPERKGVSMNKICAIAMMTALTAPFMTPVTARAATGTGTITIQSDREEIRLSDKTFTAYLLFDLTYVKGGEEDKDNTNDYAYVLRPEYKDFFMKDLGLTLTEDYPTVSAVAYHYIQSLGSDTLAINRLAKRLYDYAAARGLSGAEGVALPDQNACRISSLTNGYYLVYETATEPNGTTSKAILSSVVVQVDESGRSGVKHVLVTPKVEVPGLDKQIYHNDEDTWEIVGDNEIGDIIRYRIISDIPDTTGYQHYRYCIHDVMEEGLTLLSDSFSVVAEKKTVLDTKGQVIQGNERLKALAEVADIHVDPQKGTSLEVAVGDLRVVMETKEVKDGWTMTGQGEKDDCDFHIAFDRSCIDQARAEGYTDFLVYYEARLNEKAELAYDHNDNTAWLEYQNHPYEDESHTSLSKEATVFDFTLAFETVKVNEIGNPLKEARFSLMDGYGVEAEALSFYVDENNRYYRMGEEEVKDLAANGVDTSSWKLTTTITSAADGKISIIGLDDEKPYRLVETAAPAGYVPAEPVAFTLKAEYDPDTLDSFGAPCMRLTVDGPGEGAALVVSSQGLAGLKDGVLVDGAMAELPLTGSDGRTGTLPYALALIGTGLVVRKKWAGRHAGDRT